MNGPAMFSLVLWIYINSGWILTVIGSPTNSLNGFSHVGITTDNLERATLFYTDVMGGMLIPQLSPPGGALRGTQHYNRVFQKEILDARNNNQNPDDVGVANITDIGEFQMRWNFVLFDNSLIQLIQYANTSSAHYERRDPDTSPAFIANPHIDFWVQDDADFNYYIYAVENKSESIGMTKVRFNRPVTVDTEEERKNVSIEDYGITSSTGPFAGLSYAYFKGPSGEQLELYRFVNQTKYNFGKEYCGRRSVSTAFIDNYEENEYKKAAGYSGKTYGLIQYGVRTENLFESVRFFTEVLGGKLIDKPLQAMNVSGTNNQNMLFTKEIIDANNRGVHPRDIGVANVLAGQGRLDHRFILFDNYVVEPLLYTDGPALTDPAYNPRYNWSSPAYIGNMQAGFMVQENVDFNQFIYDIEDAAEKAGFSQVKGNRIVDVKTLGEKVPLNQYSQEFTEGNLDGFNYVYMKGPTGEQLMFTQFRRTAAEILRAAIVKYRGVSTRFSETNPHITGSMNSYCAQFPENLGPVY